MTTLYHHHPLDSVELAEALPEGKRVLHEKDNGNSTIWRVHHPAGNASRVMLRTLGTSVSVRRAIGRWRGTLTAMVPVDAGEEMTGGRHLDDGDPRTFTRLVTPWVELR